MTTAISSSKVTFRNMHHRHFIFVWLSLLCIARINAVSESFAKEMDELFRSKPSERHGNNIGAFMSQLDRKLSNMRTAARSAAAAQQTERIQLHHHARDTFVLRLQTDCGMSCHQSLTAAIEKIDSNARYHLIGHSHAFASMSIAAMDQLFASQEDEIGSQMILEYVPLLPMMKVDAHIFAHEEDDSPTQTMSEDSHCREYYVIPMALSSEELTVFQSKVDILKNDLKAEASFDVEVATVEPLEQSTTKLVVRPFKKEDNSPICDYNADRKIIESLSQLPEVVWIEQRNRIISFNRWSKGTCQTGEWNNVPLYQETENANITGAGEIIGVADTGIDMKSCYFHDPNVNPPFDRVDYTHRKVVYYNTYQDNIDDAETQDAHGTHVAGTVAGFAGAGFGYGDFVKYNGVAYNAKIAFYDIHKTHNSQNSLGTPSNLNNLFLPLYEAGARIFSNSWGDEKTTTNPVSATYTSAASDIDRFMWNYPESLILFAAGNQGGTSGSTTSVSKSISNQCANKNGVCVGASLSDHKSWLAYSAGTADSHQDIQSLAYFSSRGPTNDNRIKPDIVAPGFYVTSAAGSTNASELHCGVRALSGTSMSTPTAAGLATLIRQYFLQGFYPTGSRVANHSFVPSGALIKAMLVTSAVPLTEIPFMKGIVVFATQPLLTTPDSNQGYGRVQLDNALHFAQASADPINLFVVGAASDESSHYVELKPYSYRAFTFQTSNDESVPIRITLAYTDYPGSAMSSSSSSSVVINKLRLRARSASGISYSPPTIDNLQVISIDEPSPNTVYTVNVSANALSYIQPFALVIRGKVSFLNASYDEIPLSDSSTVDRLTALGNAQVSTGASYYIGVLAALAFILAVLSSYLYFKIRWKFNRDNQEAEEQLLQQGVQASLRQQENQRVSRNMRHQE